MVHRLLYSLNEMIRIIQLELVIPEWVHVCSTQVTFCMRLCVCVCVCVCVRVSLCVRLWADMHVFWTHVCVDCVLYTMIQYTYLCYMYDPNSVLDRGLALRESQQAGKKRKTDTGLSARAAQSAVQKTKTNIRMAKRNRTRPLPHTHTHTT
jgi:hypothetical protein